MVLVVGFSAIIYVVEPRRLSWEIDRRDTVPSWPRGCGLLNETEQW